MSANTNITGVTNYALQESLSAYAYEAYTTAKRLSGTGLVSSNPLIDRNTETYVGQMRWHKPLTPVINIASLTTATDGTVTTNSSAFLSYVKTVRTHGASKVNLKQVVTQEDGLAQFGRDFATTQANDEHNALLAICRGVMIAEALNGAATGSGTTGLGGQDYANDPDDSRYGFYVDLGAAKPIVAASPSVQGAARAEGFLNAMAMAWKDYEPEYAYLVTSPEIMASLRSANLIDNVPMVDQGVQFNTIFGGKLRLVQTRGSQGLTAAQLTKINTGAGVDIVGTKASFVVLPGALAFEPLDIPEPVEVYRDARKYGGGGTTDIWFRWGYIAHPAGYSWAGSQDKFASDADYINSVTGGVPEVLTAATVGVTTTGTWLRRKSSALGLGILTVFHA